MINQSEGKKLDWSTTIRELKISDGPPSECEFLVACRVAKKDAERFIVVLLDRSSNRLVNLKWTPGDDIVVDYTNLEQELPPDIFGASMAGHKLVFYDDEERVFGINLKTGAFGQIWKFSGPVVLTPCGNWLIGATDHGLVTKFFWSLDPAAPLAVADIQPLLVTLLDAHDALVIPQTRGSRPKIAIGCYGWIELVSIKHAKRKSIEPISARSRSIAAEGLQFDPIYMNAAWKIVPPLFGPTIYATDEGSTGVIAIDTRTDAVSQYPQDILNYGNIRSCIAAIDSSACLVTVRDSSTFHWIPGSDPQPITPIGGCVMQWGNGSALVMDADKAVVREILIGNNS